MMAKSQESELTVTQACQRLGIVPNYVYQLLRTQRLAGTKIDGVWRIPAAAIEERLRRRKVAA